MAFDADFLGTMPMDAQPDASTPTGSTHGNFVPDTPGDGDISMDPFMNLIDGCSTPTRNQWIEPVDEGIITEHPNSLVDEEVTTAYQKMSSFCVSPIFPSQLVFLYSPAIDPHVSTETVLTS